MLANTGTSLHLPNFFLDFHLSIVVRIFFSHFVINVHSPFSQQTTFSLILHVYHFNRSFFINGDVCETACRCTPSVDLGTKQLVLSTFWQRKDDVTVADNTYPIECVFRHSRRFILRQPHCHVVCGYFAGNFSRSCRFQRAPIRHLARC